MPENLGKLARKYRQDHRLTLAELALKSGVSAATISRFERGEQKVRLSSAIAVFDVLGYSLSARYNAAPPARLFSGDDSVDMWDRINQAETIDDLKTALYFVCCQLQEMETLLASHGIFD